MDDAQARTQELGRLVAEGLMTKQDMIDNWDELSKMVHINGTHIPTLYIVR